MEFARGYLIIIHLCTYENMDGVGCTGKPIRIQEFPTRKFIRYFGVMTTFYQL